MNICQAIISDGWGGAEAWLHEFCRCLYNQGETVFLIVNQEILPHYIDLRNITIFNIGPVFPPPNRRFPLQPRRFRNLAVRQVAWLLNSYIDEPARYRHFKVIRRKVMQFLTDNQVEVIHTHSPLATILADRCQTPGIPHVAAEQGEHELRGAIPVHPLLRIPNRWRSTHFARAMGKADGITVLGQFMLKEMTEWGIPLKCKPTVIACGVDVPGIQRNTLLAQPLAGKFNLLFPGGPKPSKGGDLLLRALGQIKDDVPDLHLYVALDVPGGHSLRRMVNDFGLTPRVTFTGFLPVPEYRRLLRSVDVFVLPSRMEAFGLSSIEAMAMGKPVIASTIGGLSEHIRNGRNGLIVDLTPESIARAVLTLYNSPEMCERMAQNNLNDIQRYDSFNVSREYIDFYAGLNRSARRECYVSR